MKKIARMLILVWLAVGLTAGWSGAEVEWNIPSTLKLQSPPKDVAVALNGRYFYILSEEGDIYIYTPNGMLQGRIPIGADVDQIKVGPREDVLLLMNKKESMVQTLIIDFIQEIDVAGSPFKGKEDAPVTIVIFSDFQ